MYSFSYKNDKIDIRSTVDDYFTIIMLNYGLILYQFGFESDFMLKRKLVTFSLRMKNVVSHKRKKKEKDRILTLLEKDGKNDDF